MEAAYLPGQGRLGRLRSPRLLAAFGDERLVEQVRAGNDAAFEVLYERHHRGILAFCRQMLGSREEAEDAVQQTFVSAYGALRDDNRPINFKPFAYTIARNRSLSMLRARREHASDAAEPATAGLSEEVEQRADLRQLLRDLASLPERQREALVLSEVGALSHPEVAEVIGCEVHQVKSLVFQARTALMEHRNARDIPCGEIRVELATASGGALRRGPLRKHLKDCDACRAYRDEVRKQRRMLAVVLPVVPTLGLKESALAAVGITGGGAGLGGGGLGAGIAAKIGGGKLATVAVVAGTAAVGGGVVATQSGGRPDDRGSNAPAESAPPSATGSGVAVPPSGSGAGAPADGDEEGREQARRRSARGDTGGGRNADRHLTPAERRAAQREKRAKRRAGRRAERLARIDGGSGDGSVTDGSGRGGGGGADSWQNGDGHLKDGDPDRGAGRGLGHGTGGGRENREDRDDRPNCDRSGDRNPNCDDDSEDDLDRKRGSNNDAIGKLGNRLEDAAGDG